MLKNLITGQCQEIPVFSRLQMHVAKGRSIVTASRSVVPREQRQRQREATLRDGRFVHYLNCGDVFMDIYIIHMCVIYITYVNTYQIDVLNICSFSIILQ